MMAEKRKIAVVVTHRTPYGRLRPVLRAVMAHPRLELQLIVGVPMSLRRLFFALKHSRYESLLKALPWLIRSRVKMLRKRGDAGHELLAQLIRNDGFSIDRYLPMFLQGGDLATMLKTQAGVLLELPSMLEELKPDVLLVHADRFEMLPVAMAGSTLNIPTAHTQGGDVSGTFDETVRHAITKLAHIHFPTTETSKARIVQMGEDPRYIFMTGCPTIDAVRQLDLSTEGIYGRNGKGYGDRVDFTKPYLLVLQHPVTSEYAQSKRNMEETLAAVKEAGMPTLLFWPNLDGGTDGASEAVRDFLAGPGLPVLSLYKTFNTDDFYRALNGCAVAVGNSSSFIREASYLGTPVVMVGTRQQRRQRADNVHEVGYDREEIGKAIRLQLAHGRYPASSLYGDGQASVRIAETLATIELPSTQKTFHTREAASLQNLE